MTRWIEIHLGGFNLLLYSLYKTQSTVTNTRSIGWLKYKSIYNNDNELSIILKISYSSTDTKISIGNVTTLMSSLLNCMTFCRFDDSAQKTTCQNYKLHNKQSIIEISVNPILCMQPIMCISPQFQIKLLGIRGCTFTPIGPAQTIF